MDATEHKHMASVYVDRARPFSFARGSARCAKRGPRRPAI